MSLMFMYYQFVYGTFAIEASEQSDLNLYMQKIIKDKPPFEFNGYKILGIVAFGRRGHVYKVKSVKENKTYAMKSIFIHNGKLKRYPNEFIILRHLKETSCEYSLNLVTHWIRSFDIDRNILFIVFDLYNFDMRVLISSVPRRLAIIKKLYSAKNSKFFLERAQQTSINSIRNIRGAFAGFIYNLDTYKVYFKQALQAIDNLHVNDICHNNIKPSSILIKGNKLALCSFRLAIRLKASRNSNNIAYGDLLYTAPEAIYPCFNYDKKVDIWSIGIVFIELLIGGSLFNGTNIIEVKNNILEFFGHSLNAVDFGPNNFEKLILRIRNSNHKLNVDEKLLFVLSKCVEVNPNYRLTASELLSFVFFH